MTLREAMLMAVERNPSIRQSQLNVVLAELAVHRARLDRLSASIDVTAGDTVGFSWNPVQPAKDQALLNNSLDYGVSALMSVPLYSGGAVTQRIARSETTLEQSGLDHIATVRDLERAVYQAYWTILGYDLQQDAAREALAQSQQALDIIAAKMDSGLAAPLELNRFKVDVLSQEQQLMNLQLASYTARQTLLRLLHVDADSIELTDEAQSLVARPPEQDLERLVAEAQHNRPELLVLDVARDGAEIDRRLARAAYYPSISFDVAAQTAADVYWYDNESLERAELGPTVSLTAGINLQWNLFNLWNTRYQVQQADVAIEIVAAQWDSQRDAIIQEVKSGYQEVVTLHNRAVGVREQLEFSHDNLNIIQTLYGQGSASLLDLFDAQSAYRNALVQEAAFRVDLTLAEYELRWLVGERFVTESAQGTTSRSTP